MAELDPVFLDGLTYPAKEIRKFIKDILTEGILTSGALAVSQHSTPAMSVDVALGRALVESDEGNYGTYLIENDATVTKTIAASDPSNPRIDRIIAQVKDATDIGGSDNKWVLEVLTGTPATSPSAPALPDNALDLALVAVAAEATSITNANITDQRTSAILKTDAIAENTSGSGVTIDSLLIKDGGLPNLLTAGLIDKTRPAVLTSGGAVIPATSGADQKQIDGTYKSYFVLGFDKDADEYAFWHFPVPDWYDGGNVVFSIFCKSSVNTGNVVFVITTGDVADGATFDAALGTTITFDAKTVDGTAGDEFIATKTANPGWTVGRWATIKLARDVSGDNAAADIDVLGVLMALEVT